MKFVAYKTINQQDYIALFFFLPCFMIDFTSVKFDFDDTKTTDRLIVALSALSNFLIM